MKAQLRDFVPLAGGEYLVSFVTRTPPGELFDKLKGKDAEIDVKKYSPGRSMDANRFCWALCSEIGRALKPPLSKEDVYRMAIRAVGVYTQTQLLAWDVRTVAERWESHGTGWFTEIVDDVPALIGHKTINLYYGTSTYTVDEMQTLLSWLTDQCRQMELPIPLSKKEEQEMLERWGKR